MVSAGELEAEGNAYRLAGPLLARQARQDASRFAGGAVGRHVGDGGGRRWSALGRRPYRVARGDAAPEVGRAARGGVVASGQLVPGRAREDRAIVDEQCRTMRGEPHGDAKALAAELWDLAAWTKEARDLRRGLDRYLPRLEQGDTIVLRDGFVLSAAVLRHLLADPLLPPELLPASWMGDELRERYERYDTAFKEVWRTWFRAQRDLDAQLRKRL